jgi:outer membrane protein TolC
LLRRLAPLFFDPDRRPLTADRMPRSATSLLCLWLLTGCYAPEASKLDADRDVYRILDRTSGETVGQRRRFAVGRAVDTLRQRLLASDTPIRLTLVEALDVAAENSRDYQRQKETLYLAALNLTRNQNDFAWRFGGGGGASLDGEMDDQANARLGDDLSASANSVYGTRVVASFVQTFLRSVISGGSFDGSSILDLTLTQPLLRGSGRRIAREPLTQAEREVVYAMRDYERFRTQFAIDVVSDYWSITRQIADLANVEANYVRLGELRAQIQELFNAGRRTITDLGRAQQDEFSADAQRVTAKNRLQTALDQFKLTLGLPITAQIELEPGELDRLIERGAAPVELGEPTAVQLCLQRRLDYRTTVDEVEDAGRRALIAVDQAVRAREQREDQLTVSVRASLRDIRAALDGYRIQSDAVPLAEERVQATTALYDAGRVQALEKLDAQRSLLSAQLSRNAAIVDYAIARLQLMNNLEAIALEPSGLRFDLDLPLPQPKTAE